MSLKYPKHFAETKYRRRLNENLRLLRSAERVTAIQSKRPQKAVNEVRYQAIQGLQVPDIYPRTTGKHHRQAKMLKLIPPGKRGNKYWVVRGTHEGYRIEKSLGVSLRKDAEKKLDDLLDDYRKIKREKANMSFAGASERYIAFRDTSPRDQIFINKLCAILGEHHIIEITQSDLVASANAIYGISGDPATKNRAVMTPAAAVLHYAAKNKWCDWMRIEKFKEKRPVTRYVSFGDEKKMHVGLRNKGTRHRVQKRLLLLWLFRQGDRISDVLKIQYEDINFERGTIKRYISKSDRHEEFPVDDVILRYLKRQEAEGKIFMWHTRFGVNRWLQNLTKQVGVDFTPHRARHTLGKRLNDTGAGLKTIMQALGHADYKSSLRYQSTDIETIRQAKKKAGKSGG